MKTMKHPVVSTLIMALTAIGSAAETAPQVPLRAADGTVVALWQKTPNPNKPYIAQLFAPGEKQVPLLEDSPADHFHHHALMFALNVDDTNFWAEKDIKNAGREEVKDSVVTASGDGCEQKLRWLATDGTPLLDESRKVRVRSDGKGADKVHWLDWESTLTPAAGRESVRLSGSPYFGLGMRFLPEWASGRIRPPRLRWAVKKSAPATGVRSAIPSKDVRSPCSCLPTPPIRGRENGSR
jgi:hypothetical protein